MNQHAPKTARSVVLLLSLALLTGSPLSPLAAQKPMPRSDVIDVPAIGAGLALHNLFQSNMVLQREKPITLWGWATPGELVTVSFDGKEQQATAGEDRSWRVTFPARPASSTPTTITITGTKETLTLDNLLIGDVWVLGGQSNMEFPLSRVEDGWLEIVAARFEQMRILTVPAQNGPERKQGFPRLHEWSEWFGCHYRKGDWDVCSPEVAKELSAIGYVFARRIHMATRIPIGVIDASRGGTTVETWTPDSVLRGLGTPEVEASLAEWDRKVAEFDAEKDLAERKRSFERRVGDRKKRGEEIPEDWKTPTDIRPGPAADPNRPGTCYSSMIAPLEGLAIKGVIFHQGFNNALSAGSAGAAFYSRVFPEMIAAWRAAFGDPALPFGIVSLCTAGKGQTLDDYVEAMFDAGIYIREAQYRTYLDLAAKGDRNIGFASSFDQRRSWYHPQIKVPVGERISRWALATQYGFERDIRWQPPRCTGMEVGDGELILHMDRAVTAADQEDPIVGFAIAGEDRKFQPAKAQWLVTSRNEKNAPVYDRKSLVLSSPHVPHPIHYRHAFGRNPLSNLCSADQAHVPFATQRSDTWKMEEVPLGVLGEETVTGGTLTGAQVGKIRQALRQEDLRRRIAEARSLLEQHGGAESERSPRRK